MDYFEFEHSVSQFIPQASLPLLCSSSVLFAVVILMLYTGICCSVNLVLNHLHPLH